MQWSHHVVDRGSPNWERSRKRYRTIITASDPFACTYSTPRDGIVLYIRTYSESIMRKLSFATLDVFTDTRFKGNPLAIVQIPNNLKLEQNRKQAIASEFNLSETVFLHHEENDERLENIRIDIFTTSAEIPFAGHPTIGTICHLCADRRPPSDFVDRFTLHTKAGPVAASFDHGTRSATADIPHNVKLHQASVHWKYILELQPSLLQGQAGEEQRQPDGWTRRHDGSAAEFPVVSIVDGMSFVLVRFPLVDKYLEEVRSDQGALKPAGVAKLDEGWAAGFLGLYYYVILPDEGDEIVRIRARMIEQNAGEDPATGSAASALASYLSLTEFKKGREGGRCSCSSCTYEIVQGVEIGRGSKLVVKVVLADDGNSVKQVLLTGSAVTVMQGSLAIAT